MIKCETDLLLQIDTAYWNPVSRVECGYKFISTLLSQFSILTFVGESVHRQQPAHKPDIELKYGHTDTLKQLQCVDNV